MLLTNLIDKRNFMVQEERCKQSYKHHECNVRLTRSLYRKFQAELSLGFYGRDIKSQMNTE